MAGRLSVIKERREGEKRAIMLPHQVQELCARGYQVLAEKGLGSGIEITDDEYTGAGARIVDKEEAWAAPLVLKYKAPMREEYALLRPGGALCAFFHAEGNGELIRALCDRRMTAFSFEFLQHDDGSLVAASDAEIAGTVAVIQAAYHLQAHLGGRGVLLAGICGATPAKVVVIGNGSAGAAAARAALGLGADVTIFGRNRTRLQRLHASLGGRARCLLNSPGTLREAVKEADVVIGAILISSYDTPAMIDRALVDEMKVGAVLVDVTCGYGDGYMPSFPRQTTFPQPALRVGHVLHIKIDHLPAAVPVTASSAISAALLEPIASIAANVLDGSALSPTAASGKIINAGEIVHPELARHEQLRETLRRTEEHGTQEHAA